MPRKLKVFRTAIGFHDAYVAASSRKAALAAWGADADLFARGIAEEVSDAKLTKEPLANPGQVIRVSRGDLAEHLKALPKRSKSKAPVSGKEPAKPKTKPRKLKPPPKRDALDAAEAALETLRTEHDREVAKLERQREALERKLEIMRASHEKQRAALEAKRDAAREAYRKALDRWSEAD